MAIAITQQTAVFFHSLLLGVALGCFYDLFRITRIAFLIPAPLVLVEDLLFFLLSSIVLFGFMLENSYGQLRWFILLGMALGWVIYYFTAGSLVMKCSAKIIDGVRRLLAFLWRPFAWTGRKCCAAGKILEKKGQNALLRGKTVLKSTMGMMYNRKKSGSRELPEQQEDGEGNGQEGSEE